MPVKLWEGWEKLHIKGSLRLILDVQRVISEGLPSNSQSFSEGWACLAQCHYRKHKVSNHSDKTEQGDPLCPGGCRSSRCTLLLHSAAPLSWPLSTIPQTFRDGRGVKGAWKKKLQVLCLSSRFASPTLLLSPSQISPFPVIFHHWRRHQVFS